MERSEIERKISRRTEELLTEAGYPGIDVSCVIYPMEHRLGTQAHFHGDLDQYGREEQEKIIEVSNRVFGQAASEFNSEMQSLEITDDLILNDIWTK